METDNSGEILNESDQSLDATEATALATWLEKTLKDKVTEIRVSKRLTNSPAMITDHQSAALQRMMRFVNQQAKGGDNSSSSQGMPKMAMEVNPAHPIILRLYNARTTRCVAFFLLFA